MIKPRITLIKVALIPTMLLGLHSAHAHEGARGIVKERMDRFEASKTSVKQIKRALKSQAWTVIQQEAGALQIWAREMPIYFPEGSNEAPSEARDAIWTDWEEFLYSVQSFEQSTSNLLKASNNKSNDATARSYKDLLKSCKACHDRFKR